jgi:RNA polymerase sigma-70 factor (ECF subfamily)
MPKVLSDQDIIASFKRGEHDAFNHLFRLHYRPLVYYGNQLVNDEQEAEDIVVDTFVKLLRKRADFDNLKDIKAFLFVAVRNACYDYLRYMQRHETSHQELFYLAGKQDIMEDKEMIKAKVLQEIYNEIEHLPGQCQKVFKYIFFNGLTTDQIANEMNISPQTVLNQKTRALRMLRLSLLKKDLLPTAITLYYFALIFYQLTAAL